MVKLFGKYHVVEDGQDKSCSHFALFTGEDPSRKRRILKGRFSGRELVGVFSLPRKEPDLGIGQLRYDGYSKSKVMAYGKKISGCCSHRYLVLDKLGNVLGSAIVNGQVHLRLQKGVDVGELLEQFPKKESPDVAI